MDNVEFVNFQHHREPRLIETPDYLRALSDELLDDLLADCNERIREITELQAIVIHERDQRDKDKRPYPDRPA
jgi:hypothetical protein